MREEFEGMARDVDTFAQDLSRDVDEVATETQKVADTASTSLSDLTPPPPPRDLTPALPAPAAVHSNGVAQDHDEEEAKPAFGDYRPQ
jgi:hypothetical protein